jgi:ABC transport system ATP-binding/permease protein
LEEYLKGFQGCVIVVSHDRFFMDKIVDHLFVFEGNGVIKDFPGNYTLYRNQEENRIKPDNQKKTNVKLKDSGQSQTGNHTNRKISYKEKQEMELLEAELANLEQEKQQLENELNSGKLNHEQLHKKSEELAQIKQLTDVKELRWLNLSELSG